VKYKVSLLPESRKKQINARKSISKIKSASFSVLAVLVAFYAVVIAVFVYTNKKLDDVKVLDQQCIAEIEQLSSYREIHAALQERINLFEKIQVNDPMLYKFIYDWSRIDHPGVSVTSIECTDWKSTRVCVITGTCDTRQQYLDYEKSLSKIEGVTSVSCVTYTPNIGAEDTPASFSLSISVSGGVVASKVVTRNIAPAPSASEPVMMGVWR
jgi:hypothetical protein